MKLDPPLLKRVINDFVSDFREIDALRKKKKPRIVDMATEAKRRLSEITSGNITMSLDERILERVRAKIQLLFLLGGKDLIDTVFEEIEKHRDNDKLRLETKFIIAAEGIVPGYNP